jgi:hypothetical protein
VVHSASRLLRREDSAFDLLCVAPEFYFPKGQAGKTARKTARMVEAYDRRIRAGLLLMAASAVAVMWPRVVSWPLAVIGAWAAVSSFIRAFHLRREGKKEGRSLKSIQNEIGRNEPCQ